MLLAVVYESRGRRRRRLQPGRINVRRKVVLAAIALLGLLLAVGGLPPVATAVESLPGRLALDLPAWLGFPFIVLICLAAVFIALLMAPGMRPRRELREARKRAAIAQVVLLAILLLLVGLRERLGIN